LPALLANATNDVRAWVRAAIADLESCENGFKKNSHGQQMVLSLRNAVFRQLCNNVLAINKLLTQTNVGRN
jgi:pectinesterase inhibitor-like protein